MKVSSLGAFWNKSQDLWLSTGDKGWQFMDAKQLGCLIVQTIKILRNMERKIHIYGQLHLKRSNIKY